MPSPSCERNLLYLNNFYQNKIEGIYKRKGVCTLLCDNFNAIASGFENISCSSCLNMMNQFYLVNYTFTHDKTKNKCDTISLITGCSITKFVSYILIVSECKFSAQSFVLTGQYNIQNLDKHC